MVFNAPHGDRWFGCPGHNGHWLFIYIDYYYIVVSKMKHIFSRDSVSKMGVLCSPLEREEDTLQMWLMQKGPNWNHTAIPAAISQ